jgi:hypothetical protein
MLKTFADSRSVTLHGVRCVACADIDACNERVADAEDGRTGWMRARRSPTAGNVELMPQDESDPRFAQADRVSDAIIDILDQERQKPGFDPIQCLAGQCLALCGFMLTAPPEATPDSFRNLADAAQLVAVQIIRMTPPVRKAYPQRD